VVVVVPRIGKVVEGGIVVGNGVVEDVVGSKLVVGCKVVEVVDSRVVVGCKVVEVVDSRVVVGCKVVEGSRVVVVPSQGSQGLPRLQG